MSKEKIPLLSLFRLQLLVRDARSTKGARRALLNALTLRCRPDQRYSCFPSYATLAKDTMLDPATLKRAAMALEKAGLIKRKVRRNQSNVFFINVALLMKQAAEIKAADEAAQKALQDVDEEMEAFANGVATSRTEGDEGEINDWLTGGAL